MRIGDCVFWDGGVGANNPRFLAFKEFLMMQNENRDAIGLILSIGTGARAENDEKKGSRWFAKVRRTGKTVNEVLVDTNDADELLSSERRGSPGVKGIPYTRLNVLEGLGEIKLDDWVTVGNKTTKEIIRKKTEDYIKNGEVLGLKGQMAKVSTVLDEIAQMLVDNRRVRSKTSRWERVALGTRYRCTVSECHNGHWYRDTSKELEKHLANRHPQQIGRPPDLAKIQEYVERGRISLSTDVDVHKASIIAAQ